MRNEEWWVMRVLYPYPESLIWIQGLTPPEREQLQLMIDRGDVAMVNDEICEPVEVFDAQEDANIRAVKEHARTGAVHKIVLNAELPE